MLKRFMPNDFDKALAIFMDLFTQPPWSYDWMTKEKASVYLHDMLYSPNARAYAYEEGGHLCGACFGSVGDCSVIPIFEIQEIFIRPELQHRGLGSQMLSLIEEDLRVDGIGAVRLSTIRGIPAYDYYRKNGYEVVRGAVAMTKAL